MKHYLNVCDVNGAAVAPVDIITFGSPCQDLSVAGKRAGLEGERSGLFREAIRIITEMRLETYELFPRFAIWENVPGAFSSNGGEDFAAVLYAFIQIADQQAPSVPVPPKGWPTAGSLRDVGGRWGIAWRTLDAQHHGVPQRRRRIILVADFAGDRAGEVLFKCHGLPGYSPQGGETGERAAADAQVRVGAASGFNGGRDPISEEEAETLGSAPVVAQGIDPYNSTITGDIAATLGVNCGLATGRNSVMVMQGAGAAIGLHLTQDPITLEEAAPCLSSGNPRTGQASIGVCCMATQQGGAEVRTDDIAPCLTAMAGMSRNNPPVVCLNDQGGAVMDISHDVTATLRAQMHGNIPAILSYGFKWGQGVKARSLGFEKERAPALAAEAGGNSVPAVCFGIGSFDSNGMKSDNPHSGIYEARVAKTLDLNGGNPACNQGGTAVVFGKGTRPHSTDEPQTWREAEVASTLNVFDSGEARAAELVIAPDVAKTLRQPQPLGVTSLEVYHCRAYEEMASTLQARDWRGPQCTTDGYAVRRLTPVECARLQGFPDWWGELPTIEDMSAEQYRFWCAVLLENAKIAETARWDDLMGCFMVWRWVVPDKTKGEDFAPYWLDTGKPYKDKTKRQMIAWYNKLHTDSAEYKMWGNGVALPVARVPLHGMAALGARTLGSLFDGSGGFPLAGVLEGITPLWSSEVEPYPIAVTLARFGDE